MRESRPVPVFAARECAQEVCNPRTKINRQAQNRSQLNHDCVHLPVAVAQINVKEEFGNSQMGGRAYWQEFRQAFDDPQNHRKKVVVQYSSEPRLCALRSEERRVGKECRSVWWRDHKK